MELAAISDRLADALVGVRLSPPVAHIYHPLKYARAPHLDYLERYGEGRRPQAVLLGMNPGPWGMAQTGVPFGAVGMVSGWLGIEGQVGRPEDEHPKRPVQGFACPREEVSGARLWGWARDRFGTPDAFFDRFFVVNYLPLLLLEAGARNRTPDKLKKAEKARLFPPCDQAVREVVEALRPEWVIGVGRFAERRLKQALGDHPVRTSWILHPSPASPAANRGWAEQAGAQLTDLGIRLD